jgi:hypothetical protein
LKSVPQPEPEILTIHMSNIIEQHLDLNKVNCVHVSLDSPGHTVIILMAKHCCCRSRRETNAKNHPTKCQNGNSSTKHQRYTILSSLQTVSTLHAW